MKYFCIQVKTRAENRFIKLFKSKYPSIAFPLYFPQRQLDIRKQGKIKPSLSPVFPGYIFIETENDEEINAYKWEFKSTEGFYRFLKSNNNITPLSNQDLELVLHFIKTGPIAGKSRVYFDENSRIVVVEGPLSGLEGRIIKVDKRKRRAKISLDLYNDSFTIDLAFDIIGSIER